MSIASAIQTKQQQIANAYTACNGKGATMPATQDLTNLATCINSIQTGGGGSTLITKTITTNGTYNASSDNADGYSSVTVNVPSGIPYPTSYSGENWEDSFTPFYTYDNINTTSLTATLTKSSDDPRIPSETETVNIALIIGDYDGISIAQDNYIHVISYTIVNNQAVAQKAWTQDGYLVE